MVSISACHTEDPGSIPGGGVFNILNGGHLAFHIDVMEAAVAVHVAIWRNPDEGDPKTLGGGKDGI